MYLLTALDICDNLVYFKTFDAKIYFFEQLVSEKSLSKVSLPCDRSLRQARPNCYGELFLSGTVAGGPRQLPIQFLIQIYVSGLIPSPSTAPVPCWCGKCQHQVMETQTAPCRISTSTRLPDACITRPATDPAIICCLLTNGLSVHGISSQVFIF